MNRCKSSMLLSLAFGKAKTYFESVLPVFLINVLDKVLEVFRGFIGFSGFSGHYGVLMNISAIIITYVERGNQARVIPGMVRCRVRDQEAG